MALKHTPKPLVEEHYHIDMLIDNQSKRSEDRQRFKDLERTRSENDKMIADAKPVANLDFFCDHCRQDFKSNAVIHIEIDWNKSNEQIAFYRAKHRRCGQWSIRHWTDKPRDGFFMKSPAMRREQGKYHADLLQPYELGFNMLYGKPK